MRTTLTIDEDVAIQLKEAQSRESRSLRAVVNDALRRGLQEMSSAPKRARKPFKTKTFDIGRPLVSSLDNIGEILGMLDDEKVM